PWPLIEAAGFVQTAPNRARFRGGSHRHALKTHAGEKHALIIGAGLAGTAAASALAARGFTVDIFDEHPAPAEGASGNLAGVISPMLSKDDNLASRLSRAAFLYALQELRARDGTAHPALWAACGLMQLAKDARDEALFAAIAQKGYPPDFCSVLSAHEIEARFNITAPASGVYFPKAGWVNPPSLCRSRLMQPGIRTHFNTPISAIEKSPQGWALKNDGTALAQAPIVILANSYAASRLAQASHLHFKKVRGQVTHLADPALPASDWVWQRDGYLTPSVGGLRCLAATYDFDNDNPALSLQSHRDNLAKIPALFPGEKLDVDAHDLPGRVGFRGLTIDRLPLIGTLPDTESPWPASPTLSTLPRLPGLFTLLGLGSRGITWSALAGEILASHINAEPLPIEQDLMDAIDPARFLLRDSRKK
ncbi:MAG: tRNA 5-methylaminomethyl-2-thiouridine biosynthesis bifunctional protein, partial [Pseudomonadota bacterium]